MPDLAKLVVSLEAQTAKYQRGLDNANKRLARFERFQKRKLSAVSGQFKKFAGVIAAALGTRALINFTRQTLSLIDSQTKAARVVGTTQEVYSGLTLAAGIAGVEAAKFEKALKRQAKVVSDANDGLATYARAFEKLGLSTKDLLQLPLEQQFDVIAQALGKVENATQRVAIASDIWGAKNADLLNILELGEAGLQGYIDKAKELGVALSTEQTARVEEANDALLVAKTAAQGVANQLVSALAPAIVSVSEVLTGLLSSLAKTVSQFNAIASSIFGITTEANKLSDSELALEFAALTDKARELQKEVERLSTQADPFDLGEGTGGSPLLETRERELRQIRDRLDEITERRKELAREADVAPTAATVIETETPGKKKIGLTVSAADAIKEFERSEVGRELAKNAALFEELSTVVDATATPLEAFKKRLKEIADQAERNPLIDDELIKRQTEQAVEAYQQGLASLEESNDQVAQFVAETWSQAARNAQDAFAEFFFDPFDDGLKGLLRNLVDTLRRAAAEIAASQLFQLLGSGGGGGLLGGAVSFFGGLFGRASGGAVFPNQSYMVGENGPEMFVPGSAGRIVPGGAGGNVFNFVTNVEAGVDATRLVPVLEQNNRRLKGELVEELQRGKYQ